MPRSVYSTTGHGKLSRLNPIKLLTKFVAIAVVASVALLGTAQLAGATTSVTAASVTFATTTPRAAVVSSWTVNVVTSAPLAATDTMTVAFPAGFTVPSGAIADTFGTCTLAGTTTGGTGIQSVAIAITGTCGSATGALTFAGVTNPAVGSYLAAGFTATANANAPVATGANLLIYEAALAAPTVAQAGNGEATLSYTTDGSPSSVTTTYTPSATPSSGVTVCAAYTNADTAGTPTTHTCAISGLTIGTSYTFNVAETGGSYPISGVGTASSAFTAATALAAPTAARNGSGTATITITGDGVATTYTVVATPGGASCVYANLTPLALNTTTTCTIAGLTNGTSYTFVVTPSGNSTTSSASAASTAFVPAAALATPTAINISTTQSRVFFTADGVATTYTVSGVTNTADTCTVSATPATASGTALSCIVTDITDTFIVTPNAGDLASSASLASNATVSSLKLGASPATDGGKPTSKLAGAGAATVTWVADGVASLYTVNLVDITSAPRDATKTLGAGGSTAVAAGPQSVTFTGLTTGDSINFTVTASGNGTLLTTTSAATNPNLTVSNALATPTVANAGAGSVLVSFVADGVAATYTVSNASGGTVGANTCSVSNTTTVPTGAQSCTVTGLASGTAYTFIVTPSNLNGGTSTVSAASASDTTVAALATPTIGSAPSGSVVVNFTADGVASTYVVTSTPGSFTCTVVNTTTAPTGAQHCTVTGLTNGTSYTFTVTPSGNADSEVTSAKSAAAIAGSALATPTVALAGAGAVTVSFVADGVANTYTVQSNLAATPFTPGPTCVVANTTTAPTGAQSCKVTGLTNLTAYTFTVTPSGNSTTSTISAASASATPTNALATPTVANAGTGAIKVSFVADGVGSTYTVTSTPAGGTCSVVNSVTAPTGAQSCTATGLTNGTYYTFHVAASGNSDTAANSAESASIEVGVNFLAAPTAAFAATGAALVSFTADGVASSYTVTSTPGSFACTVINSTTAPTGAQSCTVTGLTNGTSYTFHVVPSGNGTTSLQSPESAAFVAAAGVAPGAPTAVTATAGQASIVVTWVAPTNTGGSAITGYVVTGLAGNTTVSCGTLAATVTTCTLSGLAAATAYAVSVSAVNAIGTSAAGTATATTLAAITAPGAPTGVTATGGQNSIAVTWTAPTSTGGSAITGYVVTGTSSNTTVSCGTLAATVTTCTLSGLANSSTYAVSVVAVNTVGSSAAGTASATTLAAKVTAPTFKVTGVHGKAVAGRTVTVTISGTGFYGAPTITSNVAGTTAKVTKDSGKLLTVRVFTRAGTAHGTGTFTVKLANGKKATVKYSHA